MTNEQTRELLELAAKAAGIKVEGNPGAELQAQYPGGWAPWNPIDDDGDALRLAVKLGLELGMGIEGRVYAFKRKNYAGGTGEDMQPDPYAATRLAIVRAAAEIGKAMP